MASASMGAVAVCLRNACTNAVRTEAISCPRLMPSEALIRASNSASLSRIDPTGMSCPVAWRIRRATLARSRKDARLLAVSRASRKSAVACEAPCTRRSDPSSSFR